MTNDHTVHVTDVLSFLNCRQQWDFSSHLRQYLERKTPVIPFFVGKGVHDALDVKYERGADPAAFFHQYAQDELVALHRTEGELWDTELDKLKDGIDLAKNMLWHYELWQRYDTSTNSDQNLKFIATELPDDTPLMIPAPPDFAGSEEWGVGFGLRLDGVVQRTTDNTYWVFETKTCRSIGERKTMLANDLQAAMYCWAAEQMLGVTISGVIYNLMRKKIPSIPSQLNATISTPHGNLPTFSVAKSTDTTFEVYKHILDGLADKRASERGGEATVRDQLRNILYDHHRARLEDLWAQGNTYFERYELVKSRPQIRRALHTVWHAAQDMLDPNVPIYPRPGGLQCNYCHFRAPCLTIDNGGDPSRILEEEYQPRRPWTPSVEGL